MAMQWLMNNAFNLGAVGLYVLLAVILGIELLTIPWPSYESNSQLDPSRFRDCESSPQGWQRSDKKEGVKHEFFLCMQDTEMNNDVSGATVQAVLEHLSSRGIRGAVLDIGANVGCVTFAASAMGFQVVAFEPVEENVNKLCDGVHFNRASKHVKVIHAAVSDSSGTTTLYKVARRYANTAVSQVEATIYVESQTIPFQVEMVTIDSVITDDLEVSLLKVDVQGWEFHVFRGATKLLSRPPDRAPYVLYEEDGPMLASSNTSGAEIAEFLESFGYQSSNCLKVGADRHCSKRLEDLWVKPYTY